MPTVAGTVRQGQLSTFVYSHLAGATRSLDDLSSGSPALAREIGAALAAIHDLPRSIVSNADLPSYTPNEFRQRRLNELDQAATTGKIPPLLLRRWEHAMEDVSLWRFNPCVVHGDLHEDNLLVDGDRVTAVTGWTDLRIGDPADDMAWLVASNEQDFVNAVLDHYTTSRRDVPDVHLLRRAALSAEFALAQYLVKGMAAGNEDMIDEAESMLAALADDVAEHGGQPISVEPLPRPVGTPESGAEEARSGTNAPTTASAASRQLLGSPGSPGAAERRLPSARSRCCPWSRYPVPLRLHLPLRRSVPCPLSMSRPSPARRRMTPRRPPRSPQQTRTQPQAAGADAAADAAFGRESGRGLQVRYRHLRRREAERRRADCQPEQHGRRRRGCPRRRSAQRLRRTTARSPATPPLRMPRSLLSRRRLPRSLMPRTPMPAWLEKTTLMPRFPPPTTPRRNQLPSCSRIQPGNLHRVTTRQPPPSRWSTPRPADPV